MTLLLLQPFELAEHTLLNQPDLLGEDMVAFFCYYYSQHFFLLSA